MMLQTGRTYVDFLVFFISFCGFIYSNKYVLSKLQFTYPTIFQGWQTLFGLVFIRLVVCCQPKHSPYSLDKTGFITLLPSFLFFTGSLVTSSMALANIPVPIFLAVQNVTPALVYLLDHAPRFRSASAVSLSGAAVLLCTAVAVIVLDLNMTFRDSPYFWLLTHVLCSTVHTLHGRVADARYSDLDRLYYAYFFGVITLAPASLYLEEAFQVLKFPYKSQADFIVGCLFSGMFGVLLAIFSIHIQISRQAVVLHGAARLATSLGSIWLFSDGSQVSIVVWLMVVLNLLCSLSVGWLPRPETQQFQLPSTPQTAENDSPKRRVWSGSREKQNRDHLDNMTDRELSTALLIDDQETGSASSQKQIL